MKRIKVLFLCASNGVQSPMAEEILNAVDSSHFEVVSAGIERGEIHSLTIEVMREMNIDLEGKRTKAAQDVSRLGFDFVITLCDRSRTECPRIPGAELAHWRFDDPLAATDHNNQRRLFRALRDQITQRIRLFALVQVRFTEFVPSAHHDSRSQPDLVHF